MNKVLMIGRIVAEPELRSLESGVNVCNFRIAVDRRVKDADGNKIADFSTARRGVQLQILSASMLPRED